MPYDELIRWVEYFEKRPVGWREDDRIYKVLQTQGVKEKPWNIFNSLNSIYNSKKNTPIVDYVDTSFKSTAFYQKLLSATGGDKVII